METRFSGAFALAWVLASQCLGPLGLLVVVHVACLLLGSRAGWRVLRLTDYLLVLGTTPPLGGGGVVIISRSGPHRDVSSQQR